MTDIQDPSGQGHYPAEKMSTPTKHKPKTKSTFSVLISLGILSFLLAIASRELSPYNLPKSLAVVRNIVTQHCYPLLITISAILLSFAVAEATGLASRDTSHRANTNPKASTLTWVALLSTLMVICFDVLDQHLMAGVSPTLAMIIGSVLHVIETSGIMVLSILIYRKVLH